jgi:MoaA/NifB/PqqE/SkfB family radical SAM enzyme
MGKVAVLSTPLGVSRDFIDYPYFANLGAVQAAAVLRAEHEVQLLDAMCHRAASLSALADNRIQLGVPVSTLLEDLGSADVFVVQYSPFHRPPRREPLLAELLSTLRRDRPDTPILLADLHQTGQHFVDAPSAEILAAYPEVDLLLRYEAEERLPALVSDLLQHGRPEGQRSENGSEVQNLDALPLPAWDQVDVEAHFRFHEIVCERLGRPRWAFPIVGRSLPLLSSRGCPFRCAHCSSNPGLAAGAPKRQRRHSPEYLARHLDLLVSRGARRVHFLDELANVNERHFDALLAACAERDLAFEIPNGLRADYVLEKHLREMRSKITTLSVSAESGVPRVVSEVVGKELDLDSIRGVAERAHRFGVPLLVHYMIGLPGETRAEMNQTLAFAADLLERFDAEPSVQFATPLPGTRLEKMTLAGGRSLPVVDDWGPRFQKQPTVLSELANETELAEIRQTWERRLEAGREPKTVVLAPSYQCNNRCAFCVTGTRAQIHGTRLRELASEHRARGATRLELDGGEPTLNPDLFALISYAKDLGFERITLLTNGRRAAYPEYARRLASSGLTDVRVGIQGAEPATHDREVGEPGAFQQTRRGIENLVATELRVEAGITLTRGNLTELEDTVKLVHGLGVRALELRMLTPFTQAAASLAPDPEHAARILRDVLVRWKALLRFSIANLPWCFLPEHEELLAPDRLVLKDRAVFANAEGVDLFDRLKQEREHRAECHACTRRSFCGGFYRARPKSEPSWLSTNDGARVGMH